LAAELSRPLGANRLNNGQAAAGIDRNAAAQTASFGYIRGDLWAEYALTYFNLVERNEPDDRSAQASKTAEQAHEVATRALSLAPYDARVWLTLAGIDSRFDWLNQKPAAALRMSYYTGANQTELIPMRLRLAVSSQALGDKDFQELVRHDVRAIVLRLPELKPAIVTAYRDSLPAGRQFLEKTLEEIDPTLLASLRPKG
jgi:hypothetical protein